MTDKDTKRGWQGPYSEAVEVEDHPGPGQSYQSRSHRSWGYIRISSATCGSGDMFMSDIQHQHRVRFVVGPAKMLAMDAGDREHTTKGKAFVEVEVTEADLGRLLTRNSQHAGVPCTVVRLGKERMPCCPSATRFEEFSTEVKDAAATVAEPLAALAACLEELLKHITKPGSLKKAPIKAAVEAALQKAVQSKVAIADNIPFLTTMLVEHMSKVVADSKAEINAHADLKSRELGISPQVLRLDEGDGE